MNILNRFLKTAATLVGLQGSLWAAAIQVDYSAAPLQRDVRLMSTNTPVPDGNKVAVGFFDTSGGFDPAANAGSLSALAAQWNEFDTKSIRTIATEPGRFSETGFFDLPAFSNKPIYLWIFKTPGNADPAAGFGDVEAYGLFTAPSWMFPNTAEPNPVNRQTQITSDDTGITALYGAVSGPVDTGSLQLTQVPEPATSSFLTLGLLVIALRRNRR